MTNRTISPQGYNRLLLLVAGLGGLLYGVAVGIIAGALPYLEAASGLNAGQLSFVVAAVLLGSVFSTLFAGLLADWLGRKTLMILGGLLFAASIPTIALSQGYESIALGRLLQGISAGLIGVVVPLYLAECLGAASRGKGAGIFQWLLTLGIVAAALIGMYFSIRVEEVVKSGDANRILSFKDHAWRSIFWVSLPPGILFVLGSTMVAESPRWLFRRGRKEAARLALLKSRTGAQAEIELREMEETLAAEKAKTVMGGQPGKESLWHRKYLIPFGLTCLILACTQATGINSIIGYNATILIQAGLSDKQAHLGYVILTVVSFLSTLVGIALVDRKGRKFLLSLGCAGIAISLVLAGLLFFHTEKQRVDCKREVQALVKSGNTAFIEFDQETADRWLAAVGGKGLSLKGKPVTLAIIYSCGDFVVGTKVVRSGGPAEKLEITRESCLPSSKVESFFKNPLASLEAAKAAPLQIKNALVTPMPDNFNGWLTALCLFAFIAFYSAGPGVCVWLALSELMPARIRSNGMSAALLINQSVSTAIAANFLPAVGQFGYAVVFFAFAGGALVYFVAAVFFLPETKGKTLEEIEAHFQDGNRHPIDRNQQE